MDGFDPRSAADARCILVWGANPSASAPHQDEHWLSEAPGAVVVVDPVRTPTAARADLHLQPFPGSDAALAFGLVHVLARDGLADDDFLGRHTVGWEELRALAAPCTPAWTQALTGVPARDVERAAHLYGGGPSLLWIGQGLQRQPTGGNVVRSVAALPAVTGNLGRPGGGFLYLNGFANRGVDEDDLSGVRAYPDVPAPLSHMDLPAHLEDPVRSRALVCWNVNPAASCPEQGRLRRALEREDLFTVVADVFPTDTVDLADVVLPAASWLEFDDVVVPYFHRALSAQVKAADPPGDAVPNSEIFRRLASALGLDDPPLHEPDADIIARVLAGSQTGWTLRPWPTAERYGCPRTTPPSSSPSCAFPPQAVASSWPPRRRRPMVTDGCPARTPTRAPRRPAASAVPRVAVVAELQLLERSEGDTTRRPAHTGTRRRRRRRSGFGRRRTRARQAARPAASSSPCTSPTPCPLASRSSPRAAGPRSGRTRRTSTP